MKRIGIGWLLVIASGLAYLALAGPPAWLEMLLAGDTAGAAAMLAAYGPWAIVVSLLFSVLVAIGTILPSVVVSGANALVFGPFWGGLLSWLGEVLGAAVTFGFYRMLGVQRGIEKLPSLRFLAPLGREGGWRWVFVARLAPMVPSGAVTLGAAAAKVSFGPFLAATAAGKIPSIAIEVLAAYELITGDNPLRLALLLLAIGLFWWWHRRR